MELQSSANKRVQATPAPSAGGAVASGSGDASGDVTPAETKKAAAKQKEQLKNFFDGLKKGIKAEKWQRMDKGARAGVLSFGRTRG